MKPDSQHGAGANPPKAILFPWLIIGAFLIAFLLAALWMSKEIKRTRALRDYNAPQTNR